MKQWSWCKNEANQKTKTKKEPHKINPQVRGHLAGYLKMTVLKDSLSMNPMTANHGPLGLLVCAISLLAAFLLFGKFAYNSDQGPVFIF